MVLEASKVKEICLSSSSLNNEEIGRLESIMDNFQFISDLLATDLMVYTEAKKEEHYVLIDIKRPHGHPTLFLDSSVGKIVSAQSEPFVKKAFDTGKKAVGVYGVMLAGRPTQQVIYPIYHYEKIIAAICFEKDLYLTESLLGENWNQVAEDLVGALNQKRHRLKHWPKLVGQEGFILTDNADELLYVSYMAQNLLVSVLGIHGKSKGVKFSLLLKDFHPDILHTEPVINLVQKRYSGIGGTLQITSFDLSENNKIHVLRDISELSLKEKEIKVKGALLKEIHHRVKNNLNAVAALLRMQLRRSNDQAVKEAFRQAILRLDSITVVHESLAQSDNVQIVAVDRLIRDIARNLQHAMGLEDKVVNVDINCPLNFFLDSEQAITVALIVNELISNCYEHAFTNLNIGKITIDISYNENNENNFLLVIKDNGVGLPPDFNKENPKGLGWHIINTLVTEDLNGKIYLNANGNSGTEIKIEAQVNAKK
ncbi:MAG: histidine kinase N-terminal domain-containing protein [Candidatus Melainabacteria bacterium]|nr:histidine kinase N-terminal domain-containing protein [Candidatus Melainabacteria bacterium]